MFVGFPLAENKYFEGQCRGYKICFDRQVAVHNLAGSTPNFDTEVDASASGRERNEAWGLKGRLAEIVWEELQI